MANEMETEAAATEAPFFSPEEARVIGSLIEKHLATPQYYPLTINALMAACNQKSNREPVMNLAEGKVSHVVKDLAERDLAEIDYGDRSHKVSHRMGRCFNLRVPALAVLSVLLLRKAQTFNDIRRRTERLHTFEDSQALHDTLESLMNHEPSLIRLIPKGSGQREDRYAQTLCGELESVAIAISDKPVTRDEEDRIDQLERRVEALETQLAELLQTSEDA